MQDGPQTISEKVARVQKIFEQRREPRCPLLRTLFTPFKHACYYSRDLHSAEGQNCAMKVKNKRRLLESNPNPQDHPKNNHHSLRRPRNIFRRIRPTFSINCVPRPRFSCRLTKVPKEVQNFRKIGSVTVGHSMVCLKCVERR